MQHQMFQLKKKKRDASVQVPCLVIANVCNMLTMPVVATKCLVYLLNTVRKVSCMQMDGVELCTKRGSNCSVWQSCLSLPVQIFQSVFI